MVVGRRTLFFGGSLALLFLLGAAVRADVVHLNTGGVVKGDIVSETDQEVRVKNAAGATISVFREDIARIERGTSAADAHRDGLRKLRPDDTDGHYQLGLYLRKLRLEREARDCFERALKIDPNHLLARIAIRSETPASSSGDCGAPATRGASRSRP